MIKIHKISVIGDGGWGTTLAVHLAHKGFQVLLWGAFADNIRRIQKTRKNQRFLPGIDIPKEVILTSDLNQAISHGDLIILAVPSQYITPVLRKIRRYPLKQKIFLSVVKGIEQKSLLCVSQVVQRELGNVPLAVLSGPTIAREVARGIPSTAVVASRNRTLAKGLQGILSSEKFRIYTNSDVMGLELAGSMKNIIAIACGVSDGLGFGTNTKAAILTRGLVEISRLGKALGARQETFSGLAGLGDLVTTCNSLQSRNRYVGEELGKGQPLQKILRDMNMVAEGVATVKAVYRLSRKLKIPMPITSEVYQMIYRNKPATKAVADLMNRKMKAE